MSEDTSDKGKRVNLEAYKKSKSEGTLDQKIAVNLEALEKHREALFELYQDKVCLILRDGNLVAIGNGKGEAYDIIRERFTNGLVVIVIPKVIAEAWEAA